MKRNIVFMVLAALIAPVMVSCGGPRLKIYNWTYYTPDSVIEKFEQEFNVRVIYDEFASNEDMFAKLKSGGSGYDIVFPSGDYVPIMIREGMLAEIDHSKMSNLGNVDPEIRQKAIYDPNMNYSVPYYYGAAGITVNTAMVPDFDRSWSIFSREDLGSRMTLLDDIREVFGGALTHLGFSVNATNEAEIITARNLINNLWKPNIVKFDAESFGKGYANGDFWVVHGFAEVVFEEIADNPQMLSDTVFFIPDEGGPAFIDNMVILRGSRNIDLAHQFIDFIHRPDIYAEFVDTFNFPATANVPARRLVTSEPLYTVEDLVNTELVYDVDDALEYYTEAWFNTIRID
ncbi:MAG: extracellular solute-binding protein [Treponema sp.]|nr:extracellular solute-binding protein [Treponema sp.]